MKKFLFGTLGLAAVGGLTYSLISYRDTGNTAIDEQTKKSWFKQASENIAQSEYHIRFQDKQGEYQSVNRANNFRVSYQHDGFTIVPRKSENEWKFDLKLSAIHKGGEPLSAVNKSVPISVKDEEMAVLHKGFSIEYNNTHEGMRQNFVVQNKPEGNLPLTVELTENSPLSPKETGEDILFVNADNKPIIYYKDLKVWDATGKTLQSEFRVEGEKIQLVVNDATAQYPITIDPISQTPDWTFEANQANAQLGFSVTGLGDVNGDTFEDFAIGAPYYDNGQVDEGAVFIFHGDAPTLPTTYNKMLEGEQIGANFGYSVAGAGRLNSDSFNDIVVGAPGFDNGQVDEGAIFVYFGSGIGMSTTAAAQRESNQAGAQMGFSVALAGRINLDSFDDIIVGIPLWDNVQIDEGMAQVYFGGNTGLLADSPISFESNIDAAQMGYSVSGGGDFNKDNRHDVAIGIPLYTNGHNKEGAVFVFMGQTTGGLSAIPGWKYEPNIPDYQLGYSIDIVGDVNGDGFADLVAGAPLAQSTLMNEGIVLGFYGNNSGLSATINWQAVGGQMNARFGQTVAGVGDVNNDGNDDVLIGAPLWDGGLTDEGRAHLYFGSTNGISNSIAWFSEGEEANAQFGSAIAGIGDVNRDGYDDFAVGLPFHSDGQNFEGSLQVFFGAGPGISTASGTRDGREVGSGFGTAVSSAGDVNGDGYSDIIVAAPFSDKTTDTTDAGKVVLYYGSPTGTSIAVSWIFTFNQKNANFGAAVASAGDVNNDGYSDVIIGAPGYDNEDVDEGKVWVFLGSASGLKLTPAWSAEGNKANARFGATVACAGDVNGDGNSDLLVGAPNWNDGQSNEGAVFLYRGTSSGVFDTPVWTAQSNTVGANFGAAIANGLDVNGDGFSDIAIGAPNQNNDEDVAVEGRLYVYYGRAQFPTVAPNFIDSTLQDGANFAAALNSAGDVNGDGYGELILGAPRYDNGSTDEGRIIVYYGSATGLSRTNTWTTETNRDNARLGNSVAGGGDFNGDGFSDIFVGAANMTNGQNNEGQAFVYYGSANGLQTSFSLAVESDQTLARLGTSIANAGDLNGDGLSDMIAGAPNYTNNLASEGRLFIYHGRLNGLSANPNTTILGTKVGDQFGLSLASVGDVNGDGFADFIAGSPYMDNRFLDDGRAFLYLGSSTGISTTASQIINPTIQEVSNFAFSITGLGDVNNDGFSDVAISSPYFDNPISGIKDVGRVFVYHGSASGLSTNPVTVIDGSQERSLFGFSIAGVDDVNGDGYTDILIGEPSWDKSDKIKDVGRISIYYGSPTGIIPKNPWIYEGDQADGQFGWSVASAGDVNRDGLGDIITGAPFYDNSQTNEGKAWIFTGKLFGMSDTPVWSDESNQANAKYGYRVASAGDVDGNGYTEAMVSAIWYDNPSSNEGRVYVYSAGANGVSTTPSWTAEPNRETAEFGASISSLGDVNGDGFGDIGIGATSYFNGQPGEGAAFVYLGSEAGLGSSPSWVYEGNKDFAEFGGSITGGGDLDADGYSDMIVAATRDAGSGKDGGAVHIFYGNGNTGSSLRPRQLRQDLTTPLAEGGRTQANTAVGFAVSARSFFGRTTVKAEFEVKPITAGFNGGATVLSDVWTPTTGANTTITKAIANLNPATNYKWRGRLRYRLNTGAVQMYGHWFGNVYPKTLGETSFRTGTACNLVSKAGKDIQVCAGAVLQLGEMTVGGVAPVQYKWSPGKNLNDSTVMLPIARPTENTMYIVTAMDANNCISIDTINVKVVPAVGVKTINDISICPGDTVQLAATPSAGTPPYRYDWTPAFTISNDKIPNPIVVPPFTTVYTVRITDINGCVSRDTVVVAVKPAAPEAKITRQGNTLFSTQAATYQWFKDGQPIQGATERTYNFTDLTGAGVYRVRVTNVEGCTYLSGTFIVTITSVEEDVVMSGQAIVYPNPAHNNVKVVIPTVAGAKVDIQLVNTLGTTVFSASEVATVSAFSMHLPLQNLSEGVYLVKVIANGKEWTLSFVKN